jgi:prephenate dehydrogenase
VQWPKVTLIGVGLLGGSIGLALKRRQLAARVEGYVRRAVSVADCERLAVVDAATVDLAAAVTDADLVIFCTPLAQMRALSEAAAPHLKRGAIVTDVGSVKGSVLRELEPVITAAGGQFVGSHPMAGSEQTGPGAAHADLFNGSVCVLTPTPRTNAEALRRVEDFWQRLGARTLRLTADAHDDFVSRCSHLPHVVAAELANYVLSPAHPKEQVMLCANGFRDTTRIASGSAEMWRDIALANRQKLARVLGVFIEDLQELQHALEHGDTRSVEEFFEVAKQRRDAWVDGSNASPE